MTAAPPRPLLRPRRMVVGGVSEAVARHLDLSPKGMRWAFVALALLGGAGVLLYLWLWAFVPLEKGREQPTRTFPGGAVLLIGGTVAAIAAVLGANLEGSSSVAIVLTIALTGAAIAWSLGLDRDDPARSIRYRLLVRSLGAALLVITGVLLLLSAEGRPDAVTAVLAIAMIVLGAGAAAAPSVVRLWSDLLGERAARVREEQRAEIAAHLHDSVLQTLALIQNRAGAGSEIARLARAQERELRAWLFGSTEPDNADAATQLREMAGAIELEFPVRFDVVATGEPTTVPAGPLIAASREAMLNAARHAGGDVSVYIETSARAIDVFVRDRGPGVDLDALPHDRLGIRESIIGRMTRAGGSARVGTGAGGVGTQVHLHLEVPHD